MSNINENTQAHHLGTQRSNGCQPLQSNCTTEPMPTNGNGPGTFYCEESLFDPVVSDRTHRAIICQREVAALQFYAHNIPAVACPDSEQAQGLHALMMRAGRAEVYIAGDDPEWIRGIKRNCFPIESPIRSYGCLVENMEYMTPEQIAKECLRQVQDKEKEENPSATFEDVDRLVGAVEWDWPGWLAPGYSHLLASESGVGKSLVALRIAGCYTAGLPWPDGQPFTGKTGYVLWCESEAAQQLNKERAKALGLPLDKFIIPNADAFHDIDLRNVNDREAIRKWAFDGRIRLAVIDSLSAADLTSEMENEKKLFIMKWLAELARDSGNPILTNHHLNKAKFEGEAVTLSRVRGGTGITQLTRVVWALDVPDPAHKEQKRLIVLKNNLAKFPEPIGVEIGDSIKFGPAPKAPQRFTELDRAVDFLLDLLSGQPVLAAEVEEAAKKADISPSTLKRAKSQLSIKSVKRGDVWYWTLPVYE